MFTRNLWEIFRINSITQLYNGGTPGSSCAIKAVDGTDLGFIYNGQRSSAAGDGGTAMRAVGNILYGMGARVGTGSSEPTADDYSLETEVTSSFTSTSTSVTFTTNENGHFVIDVTWTGTNTSGSDLTITELGLVKSFGKLDSASATTPSSFALVLLARHLLGTPVTVPAGQGTAIHVQIELY